MKKIIAKILKHKIISGIVIVVLAGGGYIYASSGNGAAQKPQYVTEKAAKGTLVVSVTGSGQIATSDETSIQARVSGTVAGVYVANNEKVSANQLLVKLDTTNDERSVRNAQASLQNAQLALQTLLQPASTSSVLQSQQSVLQAQQSFQSDTNSLASDYTTAYTDLSSAYIDLPGVMSGLNTVINGTAVNKTQADIDAYTDLVKDSYPVAVQYNQSAVQSYVVALATYNQAFADFKKTDINSSTSTVESMLTETGAALKVISTANGNVKNLLDFVNTIIQSNLSLKAPAQLALDETSMQSYITTVNSHLNAITQIQNTLQADKDAINTASLSIQQTAASFDQLQAGPTDLQIKTQQLSVTQAQNALTDAQQNLEYDYVRAPYAGTVTDITAKVGQPASGTLATLLSPTQLAQATLNEVDIVHVKVGQKATITFDALPNVSLTGTVSEVDTLGTVSQGVVSYNVQVALDAPNPLVKPGMSDTAAIVTDVKQDALLVSNSAVTTQQGNSYVQVMGSNGTPQSMQVTTGESNDTMIEILSGIQEGDEVITQTINAGTATAQKAASGAGGGAAGGLRIFGGGARGG